MSSPALCRASPKPIRAGDDRQVCSVSASQNFQLTPERQRKSFTSQEQTPGPVRDVPNSSVVGGAGDRRKKGKEETKMKCERCGKQADGYDLHDYCAKCGMNLCDHCMQKGCCGQVPAENGSVADEISFISRQGPPA